MRLYSVLSMEYVMIIVTKGTVSEMGRCNLCTRQPKIEDTVVWTIRSMNRARTSVISICDDCRKELVASLSSTK